jgi:serine/threonine protein kinase
VGVDSLTSLNEALRQHHLLEDAQLEALGRQPLAGFTDPRTLARELVRRTWLTPHQVNQLFLGRGHDLVLGSYVLLDKVGSGGMGQVFKARNWKLGHIVALKLIRKERLASPEAVRRFHREIRLAAQLDHPNIVRALDADEVAGAHFLVMEYVDGTDLAHIVQKRGALPSAEACEYIRQAALGLQHAFERGMVHRDIKPHNLLVTSQGATLKILDMGLARISQPAGDGEPGSIMTQEGAVMGTPDYIAPEQALNSHQADIRADLYSLGCTLYFLLAGRVPFVGGSMTQKLLWHQARAPQPLEEVRPGVPAEVAAVVQQLMAKKPDDRFQTPAELVDALADPAAWSSSTHLPKVRPALDTAHGTADTPFCNPAPTLMHGELPAPTFAPEGHPGATVMHSGTPAEVADPFALPSETVLLQGAAHARRVGDQNAERRHWLIATGIGTGLLLLGLLGLLLLFARPS